LSEYGISLRRKDFEKALDLVSSGNGKILMDNIRDLSKDFEQEEIAILNSRTSENESNIIANYRNFIIFGIFSISLILVFYFRIRDNAIKLLQYRNKQDELISELNYQNKQLDDFAHITSHNIRSPASNIHTLISLLDEHSSIDEFKLIYEKLSHVSKNLNETLNELVEVLHVKKRCGYRKANP
jgi:signal transduction histidine kinase